MLPGWQGFCSGTLIFFHCPFGLANFKFTDCRAMLSTIEWEVFRVRMGVNKD